MASSKKDQDGIDFGGSPTGITHCCRDIARGESVKYRKCAFFSGYAGFVYLHKLVSVCEVILADVVK